MRTLTWALVASAGAVFCLLSEDARANPVEGACSGTIDGKKISGQTMLMIDNLPIDGSPFSAAECECKTRDIQIGINMAPSGVVPYSMSYIPKMFIGAETCNIPIQRPLLTCDQITPTNPLGNLSSAIDYANFAMSQRFSVSIPSETIISPDSNHATQMTPKFYCQDQTTNNTVTITLGPDSQPASCNLTVPVHTKIPAIPEASSLVVSRGDEALGISWSYPAVPMDIIGFQILCRESKYPNIPIMPGKFCNYYTVCINGRIFRSISFQHSNSSCKASEVSTGDFERMHPSFVCSGLIPMVDRKQEFRLTGLSNEKAYDLRLVAIDRYGNAHSSDSIGAQPAPIVNPISVACKDNHDCPAGFGCMLNPLVRNESGNAFWCVLGLILVRLFTRKDN